MRRESNVESEHYVKIDVIIAGSTDYQSDVAYSIASTASVGSALSNVWEIKG